jgi:hypothetical protein
MTMQSAKRNVAGLLGLAVGVTLIGSCGGSSNGPANITITGSLSGSRRAARAERSSFTGYELYCVTFASPAASGTGIVDSNQNISVTLAAANTPFGCFLLDASGNIVAQLAFTDSNSNSGNVATLSGNTNLGTITVNTTGGSAQAQTPVTLGTTTSGAPCPLGVYYNGDIGPGDHLCSGPDATATLFVAQSANGQYSVSQTFTQAQAGNNICGTYTFLPSSSAIQYSNGTLMFTFTPTGAPGPISVTMTFNATCSSVQWQLTETGCSSSGSAASPIQICSHGGGATQSCTTNVFTFARK